MLLKQETAGLQITQFHLKVGRLLFNVDSKWICKQFKQAALLLKIDESFVKIANQGLQMLLKFLETYCGASYLAFCSDHCT